MEVDSRSIRLRQIHRQHEGKKVGEGQQPLLRKTLICYWYFVRTLDTSVLVLKGFVYQQVLLDRGDIKNTKEPLFKHCFPSSGI